MRGGGRGQISINVSTAAILLLPVLLFIRSSDGSWKIAMNMLK